MKGVMRGREGGRGCCDGGERGRRGRGVAVGGGEVEGW